MFSRFSDDGGQNKFLRRRRRRFGDSLNQLLAKLGILEKLNEAVLAVLDVEGAEESYRRDSFGLVRSAAVSWPSNGIQLNVGNSCKPRCDSREAG